ncbi:hypothetical protein BpHYR1_048337 [Brachionus plicatilis]|uniref:Uncharacterized protein n=1 Tax=Brachionus plicatilis TaxID=10195 RepID=A0A3M7P373_BRAPC|nr:hypothetical protein BpHYR1_048337 [Brachionus plicatilis]
MCKFDRGIRFILDSLTKTIHKSYYLAKESSQSLLSSRLAIKGPNNHTTCYGNSQICYSIRTNHKFKRRVKLLELCLRSVNEFHQLNQKLWALEIIAPTVYWSNCVFILSCLNEQKSCFHGNEFLNTCIGINNQKNLQETF